MTTKKTLILIVGPTCVGKTQVAIDIATHLQTEIVSADSRQIYREMAIGTVVPPKEHLTRVKHHLIQHLSVHEYYNAYMYEQQALAILENIFQQKDTAVTVGGSMLYIDALCNGLDEIPTIEPSVRAYLQKKYETKGLSSLQKMIKLVDSEYYKKVDLKNPKRLLNALGVYMMTGKPYSVFRKNTKAERKFIILKIGLTVERFQLYEAINRRVDKMIEAGLEKEARKLYPYKHLQALNTIGYREFFDFFEKKIDFCTTVDLIKRNTRRYAKRQLSWFNKDTTIKWFDSERVDEAINYILNSISCRKV